MVSVSVRRTGASCRDRNGKPSWTTTAARSGFNNVAQNAKSDKIIALYLPESDAYPRIPIKTLIVPAHEYRPGRVLTMLSTTNETAVRLKEPIEQQRDFVWTSFDVVVLTRRQD